MLNFKKFYKKVIKNIAHPDETNKLRKFFFF